MALYYPGYSDARDSIKQMDRQQLLEHIDGLFGRGNLPDDWDDADLLAEALEQTRREWTDTNSPEYGLVAFFTHPAWRR